mgnify:CR=1 FL=1
MVGGGNAAVEEALFLIGTCLEAERSDTNVKMMDVQPEQDASEGITNVSQRFDLVVIGGGPAGYGAAVLFGPNTWNFKEITEALLSRQAARVVRDSDELLQALRDLLEHPEQAHQMGMIARQFVSEQQGATVRTVDHIAGLIPPQMPIPLLRAG